MLHLSMPPPAMIDWQAFSDCVISTRWSRPIDLERDLNVSHNTAHRIWHGKPVGTVYFLLTCKRMGIPAENFLVER